MLHQEILKYRAKRNIRKRKVNSELTYESGKKIGIIANVKENNPEWFLELSDSFRRDSKEVKFIGVCNDPKKRITFSESNVFSRLDVGLFGKIKNGALNSFIGQTWDFLIVIDHLNDITTRYIASHCKAGYIVGVQDNQSDFYDLQIRASNSEEIFEIIKYIKKIK